MKSIVTIGYRRPGESRGRARASAICQGGGSPPQVCLLRPVAEGNCLAPRFREGRLPAGWGATGGEPAVRRRTNLIRRDAVASLIRGEAWKQPLALRRLTKRPAGSLRG